MSDDVLDSKRKVLDTPYYRKHSHSKFARKLRRELDKSKTYWKGCDICGRNIPTEMFKGTLGNTVYICDKCWEEILIAWARRREKRKM